MIRFECDYNEGAHPRIMERLMRTNMEQTVCYGRDDYCASAKELIRKACAAPDAGVYFMSGGTQTNLTAIASVLRPHEGVIAAFSGHISVHEAGAIESRGHKIIELDAPDGKLSAARVEQYMVKLYDDPAYEQIVKPKLVYISFPTEVGTIYSKKELTELRAVCDKWKLYFYADGARLGYGLSSEGNDVTLPDLARLLDMFYIGGTKQGMLFGEALVIANPALDDEFLYIMRQQGALLAKGRILGIQFMVAFEDGLYFELSRHAVNCGLQIRDAFAQRGWEFLVRSPSNQQFPIIPNDLYQKLSENYASSYWGAQPGARSASRFVTSWATREENVAKLIADIGRL